MATHIVISSFCCETIVLQYQTVACSKVYIYCCLLQNCFLQSVRDSPMAMVLSIVLADLYPCWQPPNQPASASSSWQCLPARGPAVTPGSYKSGQQRQNNKNINMAYSGPVIDVRVGNYRYVDNHHKIDKQLSSIALAQNNDNNDISKMKQMIKKNKY